MENSQNPTLNFGDLSDAIVDFLKALLASWKLALILFVSAGILATTFFFIQTPKYEGKVSFILEEKGSSVGGGLSGLASQFGVDLGGLSGSAGLFAGDNILDILKSRTIIEKVLLSKEDSSNASNKNTLADLFLDCSKQREKWSGNESLSKLSFSNNIPGKPNSRLQDSVLLLIYSKLIKKNITVERMNKKGSIIEVATLSQSEIFSKLFSERLVAETMKMYINIKTGTAARNIERLENRSDSLLQILNSKSYRSAELQVLDANIAYKSTAVPVEVSQREKSVAYALYSEVVKNLEASRMALAGQTPIINILDSAKFPLEDKRQPLPFLIFIAFAMAVAITVVITFLTYSPKTTD